MAEPSLSFMFRYPEGMAIWWWTAMAPAELHRVENALRERRVEQYRKMLQRALEEHDEE